MEMTKKQKKKILATISENGFLDNTYLIKYKDGTIEIVSKSKNKSYDTKTIYGFLYVRYNNAKAKHKYEDYSTRNGFIDKWSQDNAFLAMFAKYKKSGFKDEFRPFIKVVDPSKKLKFKNTKMVLRYDLGGGSASKPIVKINSDGKATKKYASIKEATSDTQVSEHLLRKSLKKGEGNFRLWVEEDDKDIEFYKQDFKKMKEELDGALAFKKKG